MESIFLFSGYSEHEEAYNFAQQTGAFEVANVGGGHGKVMRQMVDRIPVYWCAAEKIDMAVNYIGSQKWYMLIFFIFMIHNFCMMSLVFIFIVDIF